MLSGASFVGFVPVTDLARARAFYVDRLGLPLVEESPIAVVVDAGGCPLRLTALEERQAAPFTVAGWTVDDIDSAAAALAAEGIELRRYAGMDLDDHGVWTAPSGDRVAWFADPDGNVLSLTQPLAATGR